MAGHNIASADHQFDVLAISHNSRRSVGIRRFVNGGRRALHPRQRLAGRDIQLQQIRRIFSLHSMQHLNVQHAVIEQRRGTITPVQSELPIVFLNVAHPQFFAFKRKRLNDSGARHGKDCFSVRRWGRRRHILLVDFVIATAHRALPKDRAVVPVQAPQLEIVSIGHVEENFFAPDNGRGAAAARHGNFPGDVLFLCPFQRKIFLMTFTIQIGSAPLRPVPRRRQ